MARRAYLDWNASAPLRPEARAAMIAAMDCIGNPSSVHGEGRGVKAIIERARLQVATAFGADGADIVFTSGSTEASALALKDRQLASAGAEHDCVDIWTEKKLTCDKDGLVFVPDPAKSTLQFANPETGVLQNLPSGLAAVDFVQGFGKTPVSFGWSGAELGMISAHKLGGPKGCGALVVKQGVNVEAQIKGGGHEMGRRAGTENVIGIAGFGAAAEAAARDLDAGVWTAVAGLRDAFEQRIASGAREVIIFGQKANRLPNTSCFALPGWKGETQVMQMDLAGFAISAGSACSSGKVKASRILTAMGFDDNVASSAIRVSIGPTTNPDDLMRFADTWLAQYRRFIAKAA